MPMLPTDPILADPRGSIEGVLARGQSAKRHDDFVDYVYAVFDLAPSVGVDPAIVIAQWDLETNTGQSRWWEERLNPAGIGITGDPKQNEASRTFLTGIESARAQIAHLLLYATGRIDRGGLKPEDDPRYDAYVKAYGHAAKATTLNALSGAWASDKKYGEKIASRGNAIWPELVPYVPYRPEPEPPSDQSIYGSTSMLVRPHTTVKARFEVTETSRANGVGVVTLGDVTLELDTVSLEYLSDRFMEFSRILGTLIEERDR